MTGMACNQTIPMTHWNPQNQPTGAAGKRAGHMILVFFLLSLVFFGNGTACQGIEGEPDGDETQSLTGLFVKVLINEHAAAPERGIRYWIFPKERPNDLVATGLISSPDGVFIPLPEDIYTVKVRYVKIAGKPFQEKENIYVPAGGQVDVVFNLNTGKLKISARSQGVMLTGYKDVKVWVFKHLGGIEHGFYGTIEDEKGLVVECETGEYDVKIEYSSANARPSIRDKQIVVERGESVPLSIDFPMGEIFLTVEDPHGQGISGWTLIRYWVLDNYSGDEIAYGTVETAAGKAIVLPPGIYDLRVQYAGVAGTPEKWLTAIEVRRDETVKENVMFTASRLVLRAEALGRSLSGWGEISCWISDQNTDEEVFYGTISPDDEELLIKEGTYNIKFQFNASENKEKKWIRGVTLRDGSCETVEVSFSAGYLDIEVFAEGRPLYGMREVQFWIYSAPVRKEIFAGTLERPPAGNRFILMEGNYLLRVQNRTAPFSPIKDIQDIVIREGETTGVLVEFP